MSKRMTIVQVYNWISLLLALALLLSACGPVIPETTPQTTPTTGEPTVTPAPTETPTRETTPTVTPLPLPPPRLIERSPAPGEEHPLDAPLELTFDQSMDRDSVEAALAISPSVEGAFTWPDDRTLVITPDDDLQRGERYRVTVTSTAHNAEGTPLAESIVFEFDTVGYLTVSEVVPAPGSDELHPDTTVTVVFNRPVVPLTAINRQGELPDPLTFMPPVRGEGEWLNTSIYLFRPEEGFLPATKYKARVAAGLIDATGGILDEDYTWEFTTLRPAILEISPPKNFDYAGPGTVISVTFNQPMDHASVVEHFSLKTGSQTAEESAARVMEGVFRWSGGETPIAPETMVFVPNDSLPRGTDFTAQVTQDARARTGTMGISQDMTWQFSTVKEPGVVSFSPQDGEKRVKPGSSVRITFASPMQREGFLQHLAISPQVTNVYTYWSANDTQVRIYFPQEPLTVYNISLDAAMPDRYGATLGQAARARFSTGDLSPYAVLNTSGRVGTFNAYTETVVYATHRNVSRLEMSLYQLDPSQFVRLNSEWWGGQKLAMNEDALIRRWVRRLRAPRNEAHLARLDLVDGEGQPLPPGLYYLELHSPEAEAENKGYQPSRYLFVKSHLNLTLKQTHGEALVWATDLATGQPVSGLPITFYQETSRLDAGGTTDADGLFMATDLFVDSLWDAFFAISGKPGDETFAIAFNRWNDGINPWDFDVPSEFYGSDYQGYLYTDRPIYRPGQTVYFKGIVRADDDARYSLPEQIKTLEVQIEDPQGKELYQEELPLSDMGTLYDELVLDEEAPLGTYYIEIQDPEHNLWVNTSFRVAEYKKPEFQVTVSADRDAYLGGDTIDVTAEAVYYFGGAVAGADVHWSVLSSDYWFYYTCPRGQSCPWYRWTDSEWGRYDERTHYGSYGSLVAEGDAQTDDQGRVTFRVPADIAEQITSQRFTLEVSVTDLNGQQVSNRTAVVVHKGEFYIGVAPRGYLIRAGEEKQMDLFTVDWDGEPVGGVDLTVVFMEHRWYSVKERSEDGQFYWTWVAEDTPVLTTTVTTGDEGQATATFRPKEAGSYRVRVIGHDRHKNEVRSSAYFWAWGGSRHVRWRRESNNRIELIADKDEYQVGDVAEILVPSPYTGTVQALVTVERGRVVETEVRELQSNSEVLRLPIVEDHAPNVFVSVVIVQGSKQAADGLATFKMGMVKLPVSIAPKELNITLTPDKDMQTGEHYGPRQTATYDVRVTDYEGEPVEAELSLRLADLAVLALADEPGPTLLERFWRDRGLGVKTSMPLVVAMEPLNRELEPRAKGGGGGGESDGLVRSRFADTAFWDPVVHTGPDGQAQVTVQLPDNLTTWRMQARGVSADTKVGRAEVDVLSTLDLLVRPVLPRFFVVGDQAQIATVVHNNTQEALEVKVSVSVTGLALDGATSQTVHVPAGDKAKVVWPVEALPGNEVKVRMWASAGDLYDGREDTLPVYRYSTPEVMATAGHLVEPGVRQEIVQLPRVYDPTQGELEVQIDGSLTAASQDALDYLEHYPYECVEQTVSRFLPNVVTWRALDEMGLERPVLRQRLAQMVGVALQRLYARQHYDGGWGWWMLDDSNPYLTAYVLHGLLEAHRAGFLVDREVMVHAADYVRENLPSVSLVDSHWEANRLAYQLYILAEYNVTLDVRGNQGLGTAVRLFEKRHLLSRYGQATLAMALNLLEPDDPQRVQTLLGDLSGDAITSASGLHWEEEEADPWNMNTNIRTTAIVVWAMSRLDPESDLLPNAVRWLMSARQEGYWESTQATAWSLLGLVAYMQASGELQGDFSYTVYFNGEELGSGDVSPENLNESRLFLIEIARLLVEEGNRLVVERHPAQPGQTGEGRLYYTAHLRYYLPADHVQALDRGIIVARQYSPVETPGEYVDTAQVGDVIRVKLTIIAPTDLHYVIVEDPLPAGFEGVDLSLKTTSVVGERPTLHSLTAEERYRWYRWYGFGWWWFSHTEMRDEKVALFAQYLPRGSYEFVYMMRAGVPGEFLVMPTTAYQMYWPEVFGRSDGGKFTVTDDESR